MTAWSRLVQRTQQPHGLRRDWPPPAPDAHGPGRDRVSTNTRTRARPLSRSCADASAWLRRADLGRRPGLVRRHPDGASRARGAHHMRRAPDGRADRIVPSHVGGLPVPPLSVHRWRRLDQARRPSSACVARRRRGHVLTAARTAGPDRDPMVPDGTRRNPTGRAHSRRDSPHGSRRFGRVRFPPPPLTPSTTQRAPCLRQGALVVSRGAGEAAGIGRSPHRTVTDRREAPRSGGAVALRRIPPPPPLLGLRPAETLQE